MAGNPPKLTITPKGTQTVSSAPGNDIVGGAAAGAKSSTPLVTPGGPIEVVYNPKDYTIEQSNTYAEIAIPGLEAPIIQFVRGNTEKLSFDLLVDVTDKAPGSPDRNANLIANSILQLARVDGKRHAPPVCTFKWGHELLDGVIESCRRQFVLFDPDGTPTRILVALGIKRYRTLNEQLTTMNPQSPDRTHTFVVGAGDTLPGIAYKAYGDDRQWRAIADANTIANPARIAPGTVLQIPKLVTGAAS